MNQQSEHLSNAQIESYGDRTSGAGPDQGQRDEAERVDAHLADCPSCRARLLDFHRTHLGLLADPKLADAKLADSKFAGAKSADPKLADAMPANQTQSDSHFADPKLSGSELAEPKLADPGQPADPHVNTASTPECPSEDDLRQLAAGLSPDTIASRLTHHAATCDHCGPLLRAYTEDFSDDFSPEEQAVLADLQSATAAWQQKLAKKIAKSPESGTVNKRSKE